MTLTRAVLREAIQQFLKQWSGNEEGAEPTELTGLRLYMHLAAQCDQSPPQPAAVVWQLLEQALTTLQERHPTAASLLRHRYWRNTSVKTMARQLHISESQYYKLQGEALGQLTDVVLEQEQQARLEHQWAIEGRLEPLSYRRLFGVDRVRQQLRTVVEQPGPPWLVALDGIGGIGKTSLADQLVRDLILSERFYNIAWVSGRQQFFQPATGLQETGRPALDAETLTEAILNQLNPTLSPGLSPHQKATALTRLLKERPYLVVIDNLETIADYQALLPLLRKLADPSKFVLTTRYSLAGYSDIFSISLKELSRPDTFALLRYEAETRGVPALLDASQSQLDNIYRVVGGNPLALKLVIGQICALPLSQVLDNLKQAQGRKISELYTYIYWQTWHALSDGGRQALLAMPLLTAQGGTFEHLVAVSGLEATELSQALEELVTFSLVEVGGDLEQRRYRIHHLTETFLLTEVTRWQLSP